MERWEADLLTEPDPSQVRTWTTRSGSYSAPAQLIDVEDRCVVLRKLDGARVKVPKANLSFRDRAYVSAVGETQFDSEDHTDSESTEADEVERIPASLLHSTVSTNIIYYEFASDRYSLHVEATLQDGRTWKLVRNYQDFYDLHTALLDEFPLEAGNTGTQERTLPYMQGPVELITDSVTEGRMHNLDGYLKGLLALPPRISRSNLVLQFFVPGDDDEEITLIGRGTLH
ncbi:Phox homologous domain-containing protein [Diaporthe sp. PMI_573]|nr:Phox homologous domain-containing protein [Diaporthaceae sp. PMI_573]